jgi:uncharacterized membrane protein
MEQNTNQIQLQQVLPNASATLVLGILSIVFSCCTGIIGIILGIIALAISAKSVKLYKENPEKWSGYSNLNAGRITAIIGLCLSCVYIVWVVIYVFFIIGITAFSLGEILNGLY